MKPNRPVVQDTMQIRVRYHETDGQGRVHHAQYINYFERGRVELLRAMGKSYREIEDGGLLLVVTEMNVQYLHAAEFDDLLTLTTKVNKVGGVRIEHDYLITKPGIKQSASGAQEDVGSIEIVRGTSVVACVDREGKIRKLPPHLRAPSRRQGTESQGT